jgi:biotin transport system ATP-binding protein
MIEIRNLHLRYSDGTHAVKGIDMTIADNEFLLVCGPNGSGKTTLVRMICGLVKPSGGSIRINGIEGPYGSSEARGQVGMVFQDADSQIIGETVREDIAFGPENLGLPREEQARRVDRVLRAMGLDALSEKPCHLLSGGEKRRLAIAGMLAMEPRILLFDEPFSGLDYSGIRETLKHMVRLHREGHTLVVTTHDIEKVIACVNRIAVLYNGELRLSGIPDEVVPELRRFGVRPPCYALTGEEQISWLSE